MELRREHGQITIMNLKILSSQFAFIEGQNAGLHRGGIGWDLLPHVIDLSVYLSGVKSIDEVDLLRSEERRSRSIFVEMKMKGVIMTTYFYGRNSDIESYDIEKKIKRFCKINKNAFFFRSLGRKLYLSCIKKTWVQQK